MDIITMIDVANTTDYLNLELLKVLVDAIKNVFGDRLWNGKMMLCITGR